LGTGWLDALAANSGLHRFCRFAVDAFDGQSAGVTFVKGDPRGMSGTRWIISNQVFSNQGLRGRAMLVAATCIFFSPARHLTRFGSDELLPSSQQRTREILLAAEAPDHRVFQLGQHFGFNVCYAEFGRDGLGRAAVVEGQHYNANPVGLKGLKRRQSRCLDRDRPPR
jgi:hypothetical protein